ncbi:RNA ligase [Candidatus Micrarchaeota archaeon]|mgnify:CR=1 FL=1|nr:MAG: RNA ligase [Candidatus Micrarchaeota archaeon]
MEEELSLVARALGVKKEAFKKAVDKDSIHKVGSFLYPYYRFRHKELGFEKGTVVFLKGDQTELMAGYPKIKRILMLKQGIKKNLSSRFVVEEKLDGYNVRVAKVWGNLVAVTRGGIVCPYTTYRIEKIIGSNSFFDEHEELMLCGEVIGLRNPYQEKGYPESKDFGYYVFDIRRKRDALPLTIEEKRKLLSEYHLPSVRELGEFSADDSEKVMKIIEKLEQESREGIVIKSLDMKTVLKYTGNKSTNNDLRYAFKFWSDYGQAFFFRRLIREAFQCYERELDIEKASSELGRSILKPIIETIRDIDNGKEAVEEFEIVVPDRAFGEAFVEHLNHLGARVTVKEIVEKKGSVLFTLQRHYPSTNDSTRAYLEGSTWSD